MFAVLNHFPFPKVKVISVPYSVSLDNSTDKFGFGLVVGKVNTLPPPRLAAPNTVKRWNAPG